MTEKSGGEWVTYTEAAARLGVTPEAIRQRVKRGVMLASRTNDHRPRVWLDLMTSGQAVTPGPVNRSQAVEAEPVDWSQAVTPRPVMAPALTGCDISTGRLIEHLERQIERERQEREKQEQRHAAAMEREKAQHLAELTRLERAYKAATDAMLERVAAVLVANRPKRWWWSG